ncbi:MAG TPA: hypothetical protein VMW29_04070 [Candidatus Bathyarchaeia archaeon]|nr:hypothetical protein [Candidatus Bathyarchaeia archaeon]
MPEVKIQKRSNILVGFGLVLLVLAGFFYLRSQKSKEAIPSKFEEVIVQEEGAVRKNGEEVKAMSEEEVKQMREEVDGVLSSGSEATEIRDLVGSGAEGEVKRAFSDGKFYYRLNVSGLRLPEKGYYFEGWFKKGDDFLSVGRLELSALGEAKLYYTASEDRSEYNQILVTLEPEDGNEAPAKAVLEGEFER